MKIGNWLARVTSLQKEQQRIKMVKYFTRTFPHSKTYKVDKDKKLTTLNVDAKRASGTYFGPDGKRYTVAGGTKQILSYDSKEKKL